MNGEIRRAKIENILKCIESYKLCNNILFVGGNPPKKAVYATKSSYII